MTEIELGLISDIEMYFFAEKWMEEVFPTLLKDTVKPIINTWNHMMIVNQVNITCISMQIIYVTGSLDGYSEFK